MSKVGDVVEVHFMDHTEDCKKVVSCIVYGRITKIAPESITIISWDCTDTEVGENENNNKIFTLVKKAITKIIKLGYKDGDN